MDKEIEEIDSYITHIIAELEHGDIEKIVPKLKGLVSLMKYKGYRSDEAIYNEIVYLLKDLIPEWWIRSNIISPTSINLTSGGSNYMGSRASIHKNISNKLGLLDTETIEIETKSGKKTIAAVSLHHDTDERTIYLGFSTQMNLLLKEEGNIVSVRKAVKAIPVDMIMVEPKPGQISVSEYYLKKKFQDTILSCKDNFMMITLPNDDSRWILFAIIGTRFKEEYSKDFGGVYRVGGKHRLM